MWLDGDGESPVPRSSSPGQRDVLGVHPHFIRSPFYFYAYAFGDCLVNSLYAVYEHASEGFTERYLAMLSAGGTKPYAEAAGAVRAQCARTRRSGRAGCR